MKTQFNQQINERMKSLLEHDKTLVTESFLKVLRYDLNNTLKDYFDLSGELQIDVEKSENGEIELHVRSLAKKIKTFGYTSDVPDRR